MAKQSAQRFIAKVPSYGFQNRYWEKGQEATVSAEELAEQKDKGYGQKEEVKEDGTVVIKDKSDLKHFRPAEGEEHGEVTPAQAGLANAQTQDRLMNIPEPGKKPEDYVHPTTADIQPAVGPGASLPEDVGGKPTDRAATDSKAHSKPPHHRK